MEEQVFSEFDAYEDAFQHADVRMTLRRRERSRWVIGAMHIGRLHLQWGASGGSMLTEGQIAAGGYGLFAPLDRCTVDVVNGQRMDAGSVMVGSSGAEFCVAADGWNRWFSMFVSQGARKCVSRNQMSRPECRVVRVGRRRMGAIRQTLRAVISFANGDTRRQSPLQAAEFVLQQFANDSILASQQALEARRGRPSLDRREIVLRSADNPEVNAERRSVVRGLPQKSHFSERTLRRAFRDWMRISPARYSRLRQLHRAREALLAADGENTVTAVLTACGVFELGRFAGEYRSLFGELPSQTLHRE